MRKLTQDEFNLLIQAWSKDNVLGIESLFGVRLTEQQKELVRSAQNPKARVAVSSATGTGKTSVLAMLTFLYLMILPDCRVLVTSPSYSQLVRVFYSELIKWHRKMIEEFQGYFNITKEKVEYTNT